MDYTKLLDSYGSIIENDFGPSPLKRAFYS